MQLTVRQKNIISIVTAQEEASISEIKERLTEDISIPTLNRDLAALVAP
jgi:DeoR/GlpR family transcriptional regulator of sugar metabolism